MQLVKEFIPALSKEKQLELAEEFCEGDNGLKECLLCLWKNGVNTIGCCAGHEKTIDKFGNEIENNPYLFFDAFEIKDAQLKKLIIFMLVYFKDNPYLNRFFVGVQKYSKKVKGVRKDQFRNTLGIYFIKREDINYIQLLKAIQQAFESKLTVNQLLNQFNLTSINNKILSAIVKLKKLDMVSYNLTKQEDDKNVFNEISLAYFHAGSNWQIITLNNDYSMSARCVLHKFVKNNKVEYVPTKEGFVSVSNFGNFYLRENDEVKPISKKEAKKYPMLNAKTARYNCINPLSFSFLKSIFDEVEQKGCKQIKDC